MEICATVQVATEDNEDEPGAGTTRGDDEAVGATGRDDETAVSAAQAGVVQRRQSNAMILLMRDDYSTPQQANDPEAEVDTYMRDNPPSLDTNPLDCGKLIRRASQGQPL
eukprot:superscaffoldBa00000600_g5963